MNTPLPEIPAVFLDWAGTTVDFGCLAPVAALQSVLRRHGLDLPPEAVRQGMGLPKKEHLRLLLAGRPGAPDADALYPEVETAIFAELERHTGLIDGTLELADWLYDRGTKLGTTTGYTAAMMEVVGPAAARQGYIPESVVTPDGLPGGRPAPYMIYANALQLGVWPLWRCVKIGDTPSDIAEGRNAGCWTIGVAVAGNALGLPLSALSALAPDERAARCVEARASLHQAGANYVADSIADVIPLLEEIEQRNRAGELPTLAD